MKIPRIAGKPLEPQAPQRSEQLQARRFEKIEDWAISSRADVKAPEGSTTRESSLTPIAAQMYLSGKTLREVGAELDVPYKTINRWLSRAGVQFRKPGTNAEHQKLENKAFLCQEYVTLNKSAEVIAKEHGQRPELILRMLKRLGIPVRRTNKSRKFNPAMHKKHSEWMKGRYVGDKNPNWRGAKVDPNTRLRASYPSKEWSLAVRARDGHKCVDCGKTGKLHAHHVKPWKTHPELRFDVENGKTLCPVCHQHAHGFKFKQWVMAKSP